MRECRIQWEDIQAMRYVITTTEFEFHERVYIIEAENAQGALDAVQRDDTEPLMDSIFKKKVINPSVEPLVENPSYMLFRKSAGIAAGENGTSHHCAGRAGHLKLPGGCNREGETPL